MKPVYCWKISENNRLKLSSVLLLGFIFPLVSNYVSGQCVNSPTVTLSSTSGSTCRTSAITINGNTFGGSATRVTIRENGDGSVSPTSTNNSPFSFTYTPGKKDRGKTVIITVTTDNPLGSPCSAAVAIYTLTVYDFLPAPVVVAITQPTCTVSTGSVELSGLPANGTWSLTRFPDAVTISGTGTSATISELPDGTYYFIVTGANGCISNASEDIVINAQPEIPESPAAGSITSPTCTVETGSVVLSRLPALGQWTLTRYPGAVTSTGIGISTIISDLNSGLYNFTVTNSAGCISIPSENIVIPAQPLIPSAPAIGTITQPTSTVPNGSVVLNGLPSVGNWILTRSPGGVITTGIGTSVNVTGLSPGSYFFAVTNSTGCTSAASDEVIILIPDPPVLNITDPPPVCFPETVDLTASEITEGSTSGLTYTYWTDAAATIEYSIPSEATEGLYYIKGTTQSGYSDIKPVIVTIDEMPVADAGPDQILEYQFETTLDAEPFENGSGIWSLLSGSGDFFDENYAKTKVIDLSPGNNVLLWTVTNGECQPDKDSVIITINDMVIPTLITPNMDGKNDYFIFRGINTLGRTELVVFDRRGNKVYENRDYNNKWNGVDYNENLLPDDTYFYILRPVKGKSIQGYIVIKK